MDTVHSMLTTRLYYDLNDRRPSLVGWRPLLLGINLCRSQTLQHLGCEAGRAQGREWRQTRETKTFLSFFISFLLFLFFCFCFVYHFSFAVSFLICNESVAGAGVLQEISLPRGKSSDKNRSKYNLLAMAFNLRAMAFTYK